MNDADKIRVLVDFVRQIKSAFVECGDDLNDIPQSEVIKKADQVLKTVRGK